VIFSQSSLKDIAAAIDDSGEEAALIIGNNASTNHLRKIYEKKKTIDSGFTTIHLGKEDKPVDLNGQCFLVPASVHHQESRVNSRGLSQHSFFVYGGVSIQSRINLNREASGPLGGSRVGGGAFNRADITKGFQRHHIISWTNSATKNHELLTRAGFNNLHSQPNRIYLPTQETLHRWRSIHRGKHTQESMDAVARNMDNIVTRGKAENWTPTQFRNALRTMLSENRQELRAGKIALNKNHRSWAK
jgi:hypothetical protein